MTDTYCVCEICEQPLCKEDYKRILKEKELQAREEERESLKFLSDKIKIIPKKIYCSRCPEEIKNG